jgi:SAM-dependent methyltransferase
MYNREKIMKIMHEIKDESQEIAPYVVIAQPRRVEDETPAQNFNGYEGLHVDMLGFSHGFVNIYGEKVDVARNYLIEQALTSGAKYLFFIGEDTVVPYDAFKILHRTAEENPNSIVTGVYYIKMSDAMIMVRTKNWITIPNVDPGQLIEAWQTGMDCMLIPIELLQKMKDQEPEVPFCCIANNVDGIPFVGEDNFFVHRLHKMGIRLLVNTDVQCLHMDLATGKYTAHPSVDLKKYFTNIPVTEPLTLQDKEFIDKRWIDRLPEGSGARVTVNSLIQTMQEQNKPVKFNMGCGGDKIEGYIGVDLHGDRADIKHDILTLQLPENTVDEIYASHMIEHVHHLDAVELINKWFQSLKSGGKLILELPDLEALCKEFIEADDNQKYLLTLCMFGAFGDHASPEAVKNGTASPHLWGYYPKIMNELLTNAGFTTIHFSEQQGLHPGKNFRVEATK